MSSSSPTGRDPTARFDALAFTILPVEYQAVRDHLADVGEVKHDKGDVYEVGTFHTAKKPLTVGLVQIEKGNTAAAQEVERAISRFRPQIVLLVGVAGSLKQDVNHGDVVAASRVYYHEAGKEADQFLTRPMGHAGGYALVQRAKAEARRGDWLKRIKGEAPATNPKAVVEPIVSGEVVLASQAAALAERLRTRFNDAQAVEMEGYGFLTAAWANTDVTGLVVRGISDRLGDKPAADGAGWQGTASRHASAFAFEVLAKLADSGDLHGSYSPRTRSQRWKIPSRDALFTGRGADLDVLHEQLRQHGAIALTGLPGVGKTELAIEYAHRHRSSYTAAFWCAAETEASLSSSLIEIAPLLGPMSLGGGTPELAVAGVKQWFGENDGWLLVLDNVADLAIVSSLLDERRRGHIVVTTRLAAVGRSAHPVAVDEMVPDDAALLLLRRARILPPDGSLGSARYADVVSAQAIARAVGSIPLALDQAGAYIEGAKTSAAEYLELYGQAGEELRARRGDSTSRHPDAVSIALGLAFKALAKGNTGAAELLSLCAFLAPDAIPEEIVAAALQDPDVKRGGADALGRLDAVEAARRFSLLRRDPDARTLTVHRLVQDVVKDGMDDGARQTWAERAVRAVAARFPGYDNPSYNWQTVNRFIPQAVVAARLVAECDLRSREAASLLTNAGARLWERAEYEVAESILTRALAMWEEMDPPDGIAVALTQNHLGVVYASLGRYAKAESLHQRALAFWETQKYAGTHVAATLNHLAFVYFKRRRYADAESLYKRWDDERRRTPGVSAAPDAWLLTNLADLYLEQHRYEDAERSYSEALAIHQKGREDLPARHPDVARVLNGLAGLRLAQGRHDEAEQLFQEALEMRESYLGPDHPRVSWSLSGLAVVYTRTGRFAEAERLLERALVLRERALGASHPDVADVLEDYADLLERAGRPVDAAPLAERANAIRKRHGEEEAAAAAQTTPSGSDGSSKGSSEGAPAST